MRKWLSSDQLSRLGDEDLMILVDRRDADAFAVIYERHGAAAYSLAYRIVGNATLAEDVTQEAFLGLWRSGGAFDAARGSVRSWTLSIVRNRAIDALRRNDRPGRRLDQDDDAALAAEVAEELTDLEAIRRETARRLRNLLSHLPADQSQVIALAYFGGLTHTEIAEMLGMPLGTVKGRMRLGLEKVRVTLAEEPGAGTLSEVLP